MKKFAFVALAVLALASCKKDDDNGGTSSTPDASSLSGQIKGWTEGSKVAAITLETNDYDYVVLATTTINANGTFSFTAPMPVPPASCLAPLDTADLGSKLTYAGLPVNVASYSEIEIHEANATASDVLNTNALGYTWHEKYVPYVIAGDTIPDMPGKGSFQVGFLYAEHDFSVTGSATEQYSEDGMTIAMKVTANANFKTGWNTIYMVYGDISVTLTGMTMNMSYSNTAPSAGYWTYSMDSNDLSYSAAKRQHVATTVAHKSLQKFLKK